MRVRALRIAGVGKPQSSNKCSFLIDCPLHSYIHLLLLAGNSPGGQVYSVSKRVCVRAAACKIASD